MASASRGPTPLAVCSSSKTFRSSSVAKPYKVSASSRTVSEVATLARVPSRSPARTAEAEATQTIRNNFIQPTVNALGYALDRLTVRWAAVW